VVVSSVTPLICDQSGGIPGRVGCQLGLDRREQHGFLFAVRLGDDADVLLGAGAQMQQQRGVAAVVEDHVAVTTVGPLEDAVGVIPVVGQRFAFDREHRDVVGGDGGGGVVLGREDVARGPAHFGAQCGEGLDQHSGLDGHVQTAGDARAFQRLAGGVFLADRHQTGHFGFRDADFLAAPVGQRHVGNDVIGKRCSHSKAPYLWPGGALSSGAPCPARVKQMSAVLNRA
jgi:hypothetical protein